MRFDIPAPLRHEHEQLHATLVKATRESGELGKAARELARVLHPHFVREEMFALPSLSLLPLLVRGPATPEMASVLPMTQRLEAGLPAMLAEHREILVALKHLAAVARDTGATEYEAFARALELHAETEEQVLYPAAILVGRYVAQVLTTAAEAYE